MRTHKVAQSDNNVMTQKNEIYKSMLIIGENKRSIEITMQFYSKIEYIAVSLKNNNLLIKWKRSFEEKIMHTRSLEFESLDHSQSKLHWELLQGILTIKIAKTKIATAAKENSSIISTA